MNNSEAAEEPDRLCPFCMPVERKMVKSPRRFGVNYRCRECGYSELKEESPYR